MDNEHLNRQLNHYDYRHHHYHHHRHHHHPNIIVDVFVTSPNV